MVVGAGSVVVRDVPPNSVVVGVPGRVTHKDGQRVTDEVDLGDSLAFYSGLGRMPGWGSTRGRQVAQPTLQVGPLDRIPTPCP